MKTSGGFRGKCKCMVKKLNHYCSSIIKCQVCSQKKIAHSTYIGALNTYWSETFNCFYRNLLQFNFLFYFNYFKNVCPTWRKCALFIHHVSGSTTVCSTCILENMFFYILETFRLLSCFCLLIHVIQCIPYGKQRRGTRTWSSFLSGGQLSFQFHIAVAPVIDGIMLFIWMFRVYFIIIM